MDENYGFPFAEHLARQRDMVNFNYHFRILPEAARGFTTGGCVGFESDRIVFLLDLRHSAPKMRRSRLTEVSDGDIS